MSNDIELMQAQLFQGQTAMANQGKPQSESNGGQQQQQPQKSNE